LGHDRQGTYSSDLYTSHPRLLPNKDIPLPNPLSVAAGQVGKVALTAIDHVAVRRFSDSELLYERALSANPHATADKVSAAIIRRVAKELATAGAVAGAMAAAPGIGTSVSVAAGAADIGVSFGRLASMVLAVGLAYGVDLSDPDVRRRHVYAVLSGSGENLTEGERKAGELKKQLGQQALGRSDGAGPLGNMNNMIGSKVGAKVLERLVRQEAAVKLGSLLPLGFGAGVGAVGNRALVFSVGRQAVKYFAASPTWTQNLIHPELESGRRSGGSPVYVKSSALKRATEKARNLRSK
jgi:hypothetical protein